MASTCSAAAPQVPAQEMVLSRNYESSQLHTPKQLDRITIDNPQSVSLVIIMHGSSGAIYFLIIMVLVHACQIVA